MLNTEVVYFRLRPKEKEFIQARADEQGVTINTWLKMLLLKEYK